MTRGKWSLRTSRSCSSLLLLAQASSGPFAKAPPFHSALSDNFAKHFAALKVLFYSTNAKDLATKVRKLARNRKSKQERSSKKRDRDVDSVELDNAQDDVNVAESDKELDEEVEVEVAKENPRVIVAGKSPALPFKRRAIDDDDMDLE